MAYIVTAKGTVTDDRASAGRRAESQPRLSSCRTVPSTCPYACRYACLYAGRYTWACTLGLKLFCSDASKGEIMRKNCPKTCGLCGGGLTDKQVLSWLREAEQLEAQGR